MMNAISLIVPGIVSATLLAQPAPPTDQGGHPLGTPTAAPGQFQPGPSAFPLPHPPHAGERGKPRSGGPEMPRGRMFNALHGAIASLDAPETPESLRLTDSQKEQLGTLRAEMRTKFEEGMRPLRDEQPIKKAMDILTEEQAALVKANAKAMMAERAGQGRRGHAQRGGRHEGHREGMARGHRGEFGFGPAQGPGAQRGERGPRGVGRNGDRAPRFDDSARETLKQFRELSDEAKDRVRAMIEQEAKLQAQREG